MLRHPPKNLLVSCPSEAMQLHEIASRGVQSSLTSPTTRAVVGLGLTTALRFQESRIADDSKRDLRGVLFGVVNILSIVPVASSDIVAVDGDRSRPSSASTYSLISSNTTNVVSILTTAITQDVEVRFRPAAAATLGCRSPGQSRCRQTCCGR